MDSDADPNHPIIDQPWRYSILALCYHVDPDDDRNSHLELTLGREGIVRRLRFLGPKDLEIESGFPRPTHGMVILDVRARQMEGIGVRVDDFEGSWGKVVFWARDVLDLDAVGE